MKTGSYVPAGRATNGAVQGKAAGATTRLMTVAVPADKSRVTLNLLPGSGASGQINLTQTGLLRLIQTLGRVHASMNDGKEIPPLDTTVETVFNTRWNISPGLMGEATALNFYHPGFGPVSFLIPIEQVPGIVGILGNQVAAAASRKTTPKN